MSIKKRHLISGILTIFTLAASYKIWFQLRPLQESTTINIFSSFNFDFCMFIIIATLSYLLGLKLLDYLADFKDIKKQSRIEIIFLIVFFILLFLPMCKINQDNISETENRKLAEFKQLITTEGKINYNFGKDFDDWFNDRFNGRKHYTTIYNNLKYVTSSGVIATPSAFFNKKTNWMFANYINGTNSTCFDEQKLIKRKKIFEKLNNFCEKNNIKLYILIIPENFEIYYGNMPAHINQKNIKQRIKNAYYLRKNTNANIIFPYNELYKKSKTDFTHFKVDHHWTETGAYIGYQALMKEIRNDFPNVKISKLEDYNLSYSNLIRSDFDRKYYNGHTFHHLFPMYEWNAKKILDTKYKYYDHKNDSNLTLTVIDEPFHRGVLSTYPSGSNLRVLQIGTSMNENLRQFTEHTFKNLKYIRINGVKNIPKSEEFKIIKYYKQDILDYKPDILIFCITMANLNHIPKVFEEDK